MTLRVLGFMRPKFEWLLNAVFVLLFTGGGGLVVFLTQFPAVMMAMGVVFYGGIGYFLISMIREQRRGKPRRKAALERERGEIDRKGAETQRVFNRATGNTDRDG